MDELPEDLHFMVYVQSVLVFIGVLLQILLISTLWRGAYRKFPFLFGWALVTLLVTAVEVTAALEIGSWAKDVERFSWGSELSGQILTLATLFSMLREALQGRPDRGRLLLVISTLLLVYLGGSALATHNPNGRIWLATFFRNMSFGCLLLTLTLWLALLQNPNRQMLLICGGFGIQLAGSAMGHSLRYLSPQTVAVGDLLIVLTYVVGLWLFCTATHEVEERPPLPRSHAECAIETDHFSV